VWLSLLTTVAVFYFLAALQAFGMPLRNGTIEAVLGIGFIGVHVAHLAALGIRERRRRLISYARLDSSVRPPRLFRVRRRRSAPIPVGVQLCDG
jgi:hypothetical protein